MSFRILEVPALKLKAPIQTAIANAGAGGSTELVAAVTGKRIVVMGFHFIAGDTDTTAVFKSATTAISPLYYNLSGGGAALDYNPHGYFETKRGEALNLTLGTGAATGVWVQYAIIP